MVYDGGFMAENEEETVFSPPQQVVLGQQMARWCLTRHVFLHGKKSTWPCGTLSCSLTLWPQGDPDWPAERGAGVRGAWGHRRCGPGAGTGGDLRAGLQLRGHWGDRQPWGRVTVPCAFQCHECRASGGFLRNIVKLMWACTRSL